MAGKGDKRRPTLISQSEFQSNWDSIFNRIHDKKETKKCKYFDCGYCYAKDSKTSECNGYLNCKTFSEK